MLMKLTPGVNSVMRVHVHVCLRGPQSLAHCVVVLSYSIEFQMLQLWKFIS